MKLKKINLTDKAKVSGFVKLSTTALIDLYLVVLNDMQDKYLNIKDTRYFKNTIATKKMILSLIKLAESQDNLPISYIIDSMFSYYSKTKRNKNKLKPLTLGYITKDFISKAIYYHKRYDRDYNFTILTYKYRTVLSSIADVISFQDLNTLKDYRDYLSKEYLIDYKHFNQSDFTQEELDSAWKELIALNGFLSLPSYFLILDTYIYSLLIKECFNEKGLVLGDNYVNFLVGHGHDYIPEDFKHLNLKNIKAAREILMKAGFVFGKGI